MFCKEIKKVAPGGPRLEWIMTAKTREVFSESPAFKVITSMFHKPVLHDSTAAFVLLDCSPQSMENAYELFWWKPCTELRNSRLNAHFSSKGHAVQLGSWQNTQENHFIFTWGFHGFLLFSYVVWFILHMYYNNLYIYPEGLLIYQYYPQYLTLNKIICSGCFLAHF